MDLLVFFVDADGGGTFAEVELPYLPTVGATVRGDRGYYVVKDVEWHVSDDRTRYVQVICRRRR